MDGQPVFLPQEVEERLGYADLAKSIRNSPGAKKDVDYFVVEGERLRQLKEMVTSKGHSDSATVSVKINHNAPSLTLLTESGLWWTTFNSTKPECVALRIWVTAEVLPAIRKTGGYGTGNGQEMNLSKLANAFASAKKLAKQAGCTEIRARLKAGEQVKRLHQVDVWELLEMEPPQEKVALERTQTMMEEQGIGNLLAEWYRCFQDRPVKIKQVIAMADHDAGLAKALSEFGRDKLGNISTKGIAWKIRKFPVNAEDSLEVSPYKSIQKCMLWKVDRHKLS